MAPKQQSSLLTRSFMTQVILLQSKKETSDEDLAVLFKGVHALKQHIPCLVAVSTGENQSTRHRGFTHGILLHFEDEARMRNAMQQSIYTRLLEKVQQLSEMMVILELPEEVPFPVSAQETLPTSRKAVTDSPQKRGRPPKLSTSIAPFTSESQTHLRINVQELLRLRPVTTIDPRIKQIVKAQLGVDEREILPGASLVEDLNADSLDLVEYIMALEEIFHITIPDEDAEQIMTISETQAYLMARDVLVY